MNRRSHHKFDRLKKLAKSQKTDVFSIPVNSEYVVDDLIVDDEAAKETEVFSIHQSIAVKQAE